jgi:ParB family chromosome partitioning protein
MAELRSVDPRILQPNPHNPRRTPASPAMDEQLLASIKAVGIIQPPCVTDTDGKLTIVVGSRRVKAAIKADLPVIDVLVCDADEAADAMRSVAENLIRASMTSVDIWRAIERLEAQRWNEQAIADALALPVRTVRRLKLLAHLHPAMLDVMAQGSMPNEGQLRTITAATREEQAEIWKKYKPKKGHPDVSWWEIARALTKRRMPAPAAKFGDDLARAYGVEWEDDLFAPACEDSQYLQDIADRGRIGWQNASGYTKRSRVETAIGRYKQVIGDGLRFHKDERRDTEVRVAVRVLNRMSKLGRPISVRIA